MKFSPAIAALALLVSPALAQTPPPAISVNGEATMSVAPDQAQIDAGVTSEAKTAREASDANNAAMGKVLLALKGAGVDENDYQTSRLSLQPQYPPNRTGPAAISGYRASNRVTIKVRDINKVAGLIDVLVGAGANEIGGINFVVSQASKLLDEAREKAVADARRKAEIYAKAAGSGIPGQGRRADGRRHAGGSGRGNAVGQCARIVGDQAEGPVAALRPAQRWDDAAKFQILHLASAPRIFLAAASQHPEPRRAP
jgi:uncharacterized protein